MRQCAAMVVVALFAVACGSAETSDGLPPGPLAFDDIDDGVERDGREAPKLREPTGCAPQGPPRVFGSDVFVITSEDEEGCLIIDTVGQARSDVADLARQTGVLSVTLPTEFEIDAQDDDDVIDDEQLDEGPVVEEQWAHRAMRVDPDRRSGLGADVTVAVLDTGVSLDHPDLEWNVLDGFDYTRGQASGGDSNGHGTHVAGVIAAQTNGVGVDGIAPQATILPIAVLDASGVGHSYAVAKGIVTAVDLGADIINLSFSGPNLSEDIEHALRYAADNGAVVVASAGNSASGVRRYPAAVDGVIAVSALDESLEAWSTSSFGPHVAFAAPGVDVVSTVLDDGYGRRSGTSVAAAHVSGAIAAVMSQPRWGTLNRLFGSATDLGPSGVDDLYGVGLIDLAAALELEMPSPVDGVESTTTTEPDGGAETTTSTTRSATTTSLGRSTTTTSAETTTTRSRVTTTVAPTSSTEATTSTTTTTPPTSTSTTTVDSTLPPLTTTTSIPFVPPAGPLND